MKKKILIVSIILIIIVIVAIGGIVVNNYVRDHQKSKLDITISVFDKENINIYNKDIETEKIYLIDVLKDLKDLNMITEETEYGEYITSIMNIEQGDNYYWSYYIDDQYATVGVSNCKIENGKTYNFKIEKFEQ